MLNQNPMSVMTQASKLSITQLQQAIKNGTVPPYIGVPLLQQKIKESQQAKQAMATQQPAQPPIAQQVMQQAESQGVDTLPSNLPVQGMAGGGIIAFDEGGAARTNPPMDSISQMATSYSPSSFDLQQGDRGLMPMTYAQFVTLTPAARQQYANQFGAPPKPTASELNLLQKSLGLAPDTGINKIINQGSPVQYNVQNTTPKAADVNKATPAAQANVNKATPAAQANAAADTKGNESIFDDSGARRGAGAGAGAGSEGIAGYKIKPYTAAQTELQAALDAEMNPATGKPYTYADKAEQRKANQIAAGVDFDLFGKQKTELEGKKNLSDTRSRLNEAMPYFTFAERLGQAPKPGESTITALSSALAGAGRTKTEIDDKEELRQEKINDKLNALAVAQNSFNAAQFSGNDVDLKDARNQMKLARKDLASLNIKGVDQQNEAAKTLFETRSREQIADKQVAASYYSADKAQKTIMDIARVIKKDNPNMSDSEAIQKAYETSNPRFVANDQRDVASQRTILTKVIGDIQKQYPMGMAMPADVKAKLVAYTNQLNALGIGDGAESAGAASGNTVNFSKLPK